MKAVYIFRAMKLGKGSIALLQFILCFLHFIPLIMNQKAFQPGLYKGISLYLFPVIAMIAEHKFIDGQATIHLEIKYCFRFLKGENAVGHKPGDVVFFMISHLIDDSDRNGVIQKKGTESIITVNPVAKGIGAIGRSTLFGKNMFHDTGSIGKHIIQQIVQYIFHIVVMKIKSPSVNLSQAT